MERNGLVAFTLHHGTVLEWSEWLFLASGNGVLDTVEQVDESLFCHKCKVRQTLCLCTV